MGNNDTYNVGDVMDTFVDDEGVTIYQVFLGEWAYTNGFCWFEQKNTGTLSAGVTGGWLTATADLVVYGLPRGVDCNFILYRNAWQVRVLASTTNASSVDPNSYFSSRIQSYSYGSGTSLSVPIETTDSYNYWSDKVSSDTYRIRLSVDQYATFVPIDASQPIIYDVFLYAYNPSLSINAYMTYEQYEEYSEKLEENKQWQEEKELLEEANDLQSQENQLQQEANETSKGILSSVTDFFGSFFQNFIDAIVSVFVPEEGYFEDFFNRLNDFFSEKLGMLYAPIDMFIQFLNAINSSAESRSGTAGITFPELKWEEYVIIEKQTIDLQSIAGEFGELQEAIYFGTDVIMVGSVLVLLQNKLREVLKT